MSSRLLHSVIDDLLDAVEQRPELVEPVMHFVFDEVNAIRAGLSEVQKRNAGDALPDGSLSIRVDGDVLASRQLIQFAHAIANGVVPQMALIA
ncbi:hypothetical protein [Paraburkholderia sediminicola]|uniref:hypothetical protein n=1 Tax=Paraburkholderia sediminicola TaxID=458836 RepID=UPI0038B91192